MIKKIFFFSIAILFYYLLLTVIIFSFSYVSLVYGKTYDLFWIKSIQKKLYTRGYRNIWQINNSCISYDKDLLYKPKIGRCEFSNPEFETELNFSEFYRNHNIKFINNDLESNILVLGDSIAMGWGVNDDETFSFLLEKSLKKKVYNLAVSSYGTVREIKRMKLSPLYKTSKTIIIQYNPNDIFENSQLDFAKTYSKEDFENIFNNNQHNLNTIKFVLRNYKSSIRLFFADIIDIIFREENMEIINFDGHKKHLETIIEKNIDTTNKDVIIFLTTAPHQKVLNFPESNSLINYYLFELPKSHFFIIDEHPNKKGHYEIAKRLNNLIKKTLN